MHYVDEGPRDGEVVLLLHGEPSWSYLYRKMIPILAAAGHRVIAVDLIGMGRSDKPVELGAYTYEQEITWVTQFIDALALRDITLFCQDWGSLIGLRIVGDHPDRFARVVVANGRLPVIPKGIHLFKVPDPVEIDPAKGDFAAFQATLDPSQPQPVNFSKWIEYALTAPNLTPSQVVEYLTVNQLTPEEAAGYDAPYPSLVYKAAIRAFPSMIAAVQDENAPAWAALGEFKKPFLSLAGNLDRNLGSEAVQNELINHIPGAKGQPHDRFEANHFIQEDIGEILAERVNQFIANNPR
jgi:pimeloyl-ACP methyl ester carboxylesterase